MRIYNIFIHSLVSSVIGFSEDLLLAMNVKSWITDHNFTEIINLSFSISKCCNVLLSDSTEDSEIFFDRFRTIYPYDYFLKRNTNEYEEECDGYLLLGSRDHEIMEFIRKWNKKMCFRGYRICFSFFLNKDTYYCFVTGYRLYCGKQKF